MVTAGSSPDRPARRYRTRKRRPAVLLAVVLSTMAGLVWANVLQSDPTAGGCQHTAAAVTPGQRLPFDGLDGVAPAPPPQVRVQVLNASGTRGEAAIAGGGLSELGFAPTDTPADDPLHPTFDLRCHGEIRFGLAGQSAARTLSLVVPCAELVRDARPDSVIDLALGTKFTTLRPNVAARQALQVLRVPNQPASNQSAPDQPALGEPGQGGLAAQTGPQPVTPSVAPNLLNQARQVRC